MRADWIGRILRAIYTVVLYVLLPITVYHLVWRGFRHNAYFHRWAERYGIYPHATRTTGVLWIHAVSLGEVNAAAPLIDALRKCRSDLRLLVTTITPTGSARVRDLWGHQVEHVYLPYDLPGATRRFFAHFRPVLGLIMETEIWPNLLFTAQEEGVPLHILNARLSARSLRGYRVLAPLVSRALRTVRLVAAQSDEDAERFVRLGALPTQVRALGNLKFDVQATDDGLFRDAFRARAGRRPIWIVASTHEEEEGPVLSMFRAVREQVPNLLMVWAPRHPERFRPVSISAGNLGLRWSARSIATWPGPEDDLFLLDTLGELAKFFAVADVAFIGGSLQPIGGHNLLEPAAAGVPIVTGPHLHNFADIAKRLREAGALIIAATADEVAAATVELLRDPEQAARMRQGGLELIARGRGALQRYLELVAADLPPALKRQSGSAAKRPPAA